MKTTVQKWGNSLAVRIPSAFAFEMNIKAGTTVNVSVEGDSLVVRRSAPDYTLSELLSRITKDNTHGEELRAAPAGKEVW
ncbi:MAG: AbrB/MazE/SpoVT family DNA-binding domain-containing protein [Bacillota bacterium]